VNLLLLSNLQPEILRVSHSHGSQLELLLNAITHLLEIRLGGPL
jgi:hypothetical protein